MAKRKRRSIKRSHSQSTAAWRRLTLGDIVRVKDEVMDPDYHKQSKCFVSEITPGILEQYHLQKQHVPPRQTGEAIAVRSTKQWCQLMLVVLHG